MAKQTILSWSGGKDSALALQALRSDPAIEVMGLLTSITRDYDRISIHGVRRSLLEAQVDRLGLPLFEIDLEANCTNEAYEAAFQLAFEEVWTAFPQVSQVAFGDLFLEDVRAYRERLLAGSGLEPLFPIWGQNTEKLAGQFLLDGFQARVVCVDTTQLDESFAGRAFDEQFLRDLPPGIDPCGEHGEFHTFVSAGPIFGWPVDYRVGDKVLRDERFMYCDIF